MEPGDSLADSGSGVTTSLPHNVTDKKSSDLDLVHIPLSISAKRETAIMRLTNRIKALELNVSLSSRYSLCLLHLTLYRHFGSLS